jgi:hypothetical protein
MRPPYRSRFLITCLLLTACGGGDGPETPAPVTLTITSTPALDGLVFAQGTVTLSSNITAGDYANGLGPQGGLRGFVSFDLTAIPAGVTVLTATMTLVQRLTNDTPYATLGTILADHVVYGGVLEAGAYARSFPTGQGFGVLSADASLGVKSLVVTALVQDDVTALRGRSQYRLRFEFEEDADMDSDQAAFFSPETATVPSELPTLVVTYQP